jgi:hypothetical protein
MFTTYNIMTVSTMAPITGMPLSKMTNGRKTLIKIANGRNAFNIMTVIRMTPSRMTLATEERQLVK